MIRAILAGGAAAVLVAPSAWGSTAEMQDANLVYRASDGEANVVSIVHSEDGLITVTDTGAVIQATNGCVSKDIHVAECGHQSLPENVDLLNHVVDLGDQADSFEVFGQPSDSIPYGVAGGDGDDILLAGNTSDLLWGGSGPDRLEGGSGDDLLDGGGGPDVMRGGPGTDVASYSDRSAPVRVEIGDGPGDGEPGEEDDVQSENVHGGAADDVLIGNEVANMLLGGPGSDTLSGRAGPDELVGSDVGVSGESPVADRIRCGAGPDTAETSGPDVVADSCEQVAHGTPNRIALTRLERLGPRRIRVTVKRVNFDSEVTAASQLSIPCGPANSDGIRCWDKIGRSGPPQTIPEGNEVVLEIRLSRRGRLWLRRHPRGTPRLTVQVQDRAFPPDDSVELRLRRKVPRP